MNFDFAAFLVLLTFISGAVWLLDALLFAPGRKRKLAAGARADLVREPWPVEFARSFFPDILNRVDIEVVHCRAIQDTQCFDDADFTGR